MEFSTVHQKGNKIQTENKIFKLKLNPKSILGTIVFKTVRKDFTINTVCNIYCQTIAKMEKNVKNVMSLHKKIQ